MLGLEKSASTLMAKKRSLSLGHTVNKSTTVYASSIGQTPKASGRLRSSLNLLKLQKYLRKSRSQKKRWLLRKIIRSRKKNTS